MKLSKESVGEYRCQSPKGPQVVSNTVTVQCRGNTTCVDVRIDVRTDYAKHAEEEGVHSPAAVLAGVIPIIIAAVCVHVLLLRAE